MTLMTNIIDELFNLCREVDSQRGTLLPVSDCPFPNEVGG